MSAALVSLFTPFALLIAGIWLSAQSGWFLWGIILMGLGLSVLIRVLISFLSQSFHAAAQIKLLHESSGLDPY